MRVWPALKPEVHPEQREMEGNLLCSQFCFLEDLKKAGGGGQRRRLCTQLAFLNYNSAGCTVTRCSPSLPVFCDGYRQGSTSQGRVPQGEHVSYRGSVHLCEVDWSVFGNTVSIFAGKHATVTSIHLLWNFLKDQQQRQNLSNSLSFLD